MEMGTMEYALLQVQSILSDETESTKIGASEIGASSAIAKELCFTWRSEEDVIDAGHMMVPSIGQDIPSSICVGISSAMETSGMTHIVPIT